MPDWGVTKIAGKQRAVYSHEGGRVVVGTALEHYEAIVIEAGTAVLDGFFRLDDIIERPLARVPIMVVPGGANVVKTVAMAAPASFRWDDDADSAIWAVDEVEVEEDTSSRQLTLVAHVALGGSKCDLLRIAYHITIFVQGRKYIANPDSIVELDTA